MHALYNAWCIHPGHITFIYSCLLHAYIIQFALHCICPDRCLRLPGLQRTRHRSFEFFLTLFIKLFIFVFYFFTYFFVRKNVRSKKRQNFRSPGSHWLTAAAGVDKTIVFGVNTFSSYYNTLFLIGFYLN